MTEISETLDLPELPESFRWQVEPSEFLYGFWDVRIEQQRGWKWWRGGWRECMNRTAEKSHPNGSVDIRGLIEEEAQGMQRRLLQILEEQRQHNHLLDTA